MPMDPREFQRMGAEQNKENARKRRELFCQEYVANGYKQAEAYSKVWPNNSDPNNAARRLMKEPWVANRIDELIKEKYKALHISAERIAEKLSEMAFAEKEDEIYGPSVALKALDMLQKQLGLQKQKIDANVDQTTTITVTIDEE